MNALISRMDRALRPIGNVDNVAGGRVVGWAAGRGKVTVEAWIDGRCAVRCTPDGMRDDVAAAYPGIPSALTSGFSLELPPGVSQGNDISELRIIAKRSVSWLPAATLGIFQLAGSALQDKLLEIPLDDHILY